jgi:very-short-patch-repair endonuclease
MMTSERNRIDIPDELKFKILRAARDLRKDPTPTEAILWAELRGKRLNGIKFRRQQPVGPFIVDFYAPSLRLVVEIDGAVHHLQQEADQTRQMVLESLDLTILRFSDAQVESDLVSVVHVIHMKAEEILYAKEKDSLLQPHPLTPSPTSGEGEPPRSALAPLDLS